MSGRLREFTDRPVSPGVERAILALALAVTVALGCVVALGLGGDREAPVGHDHSTIPVGSPAPASFGSPAAPADRHRRQDPQDRPGTAAHRRADRVLATHRALQHVPWQRGGVAIRLVGAKGGKAILLVAGPATAVDDRAYRTFLARFHDDGRSYLPHFRTVKGRP